MTADMAFECLFVSHDPQVFGTVDRLLKQMSIRINLCLSASKASAQLKNGSADLVVIDWEGENSSELLQELHTASNCKKPTIVAIAPSDNVIPGIHVVLKKPVTVEAATRSLKVAYSKMLLDHRKHARYALMMPVHATDRKGRTISVNITDIGDGGVGLSTREKLEAGDTLSFRVHLPETEREILIVARVLWVREYARVGCEFGRIPPVDLMILQDWLKKKIQVKKPLVEM